MFLNSQLCIDEEYNEIIEDVKDECEKYGTIVSLTIPRQREVTEYVPGLTKIFVEYSTVKEARDARRVAHINNTLEFGGATFWKKDSLNLLFE